MTTGELTEKLKELDSHVTTMESLIRISGKRTKESLEMIVKLKEESKKIIEISESKSVVLRERVQELEKQNHEMEDELQRGIDHLDNCTEEERNKREAMEISYDEESCQKEQSIKRFVSAIEGSKINVINMSEDFEYLIDELNQMLDQLPNDIVSSIGRSEIEYIEKLRGGRIGQMK